MDAADDGRNGAVCWGFGVADNDGEGSVSTNGYNGPADGLLTQPCDDDHFTEASEFHRDLLATDQSEHSEPPLKSPNRSPQAAKVSLLNNGDYDHERGSTVKSKSRRLFAGRDDDINSSSCSSQSESDDDSSIEERKDLTPIQVRRARNIERHNAFAKSLNLGLLDSTNDSSAQKPKLEISQKEDTIVGDDKAEAPTRRRGMIFSAREGHKKSRQLSDSMSSQVYAVASHMAAGELETKYPGRTMQIKMLSDELEKVVRATKLAWSNESSRKKYYSEAKQYDEVTYASPAPILVSGSGGTGKTSVVCDTINMIREKVDNISAGKSKSQMNKTNIISYAYVNCASTDGVDIAYVLNSAYKQLHGCYHPKSKHSYKSYDAVAKDNIVTRSIRDETLVSLQKIDEEIDMFDCDSDHAGEVDEADGDDEQDELNIEQERQTYFRGRKKRKRVAKNQSRNEAKNTHQQSKDRSVRSRRDTRQSTSFTPATTTAANSGIKRSTRLNYDSSPVALFGRALAVLLQGGLSRKRPKYGRCSILVLDNAERILSWKRSGSLNALAQLFKLPGVMGLNLSIIFISRASLLAHTAATPYKSSSIIKAIAHPLNIHFNSYNNVEAMKKIFHTARIQQLITGQPHSLCGQTLCSLLQSINLELNDILYKSMINSFLRVIISYISDVTEILRLSRMLWTQFIGIFENEDRSSEYQELVWQLASSQIQENDKRYPSCTNKDCALCQGIISDVNVESSIIKNKLLEKLDSNIRDTVRDVLARNLMMPGTVIEKQHDKAYAERLPYTTKFLLLSAFLCQQKRSEQDVNLFTTINTGRRSNRGAKTTGNESTHATSSSDLKQLRVVKIPSFQVERLLSVFTSIMGQYGRLSRQACKVSDMGTGELFKIISSLIVGGLLQSTSNSSNRAADKTDFMAEKVTCTLSKEDAQIIASSVGFPLDRYCL